MTGKNIKKKLATGVICLAAIAAEAFFWQKYVTTTLYGQARVMPTPTESVSVETEAPTVPETEAWDPREEVWENYENLGIVNDSSSYVDIYELPEGHRAELIDGKWQNRSCERLNDTQKKIENLIGIDSSTFKSCAMIMQDQYGVFIKKEKEE